MTQTTMISTGYATPAAAPLATPTQPTSTLTSRLQAALEHARRLTAMYGTAHTDVAIAWETVEELQKAQAEQRTAPISAFAQYCAANPGAPECRIYDM